MSEEEKLHLTPEEEERRAQLETNEKKAEEGHQPCSPKGARRELQTDGPQPQNNNDDLPPPAGDDGEAFDSLPENVKSTVRELWTVIDRFHSDSITAEELIVDIARQLDEGGLCKRDHISRKIKALLRDKIRAGKVTASWIYKCLPDEYKRPYNKNESGLSPLSRQQPQQKMAMMQGGKSVTVTEKEVRNGSGTSPESGIDININSDTIASKSAQREEALPRTDINSVGQQPACKHCPAKDAKIMELEELLAVMTHTSMKSAEELMHTSTDRYQQTEWSVSSGALRQHMVHFNGINGAIPDRVWFNGKFSHKTGEVVDVRIGRRTDTDSTDNSRMTP
jgi:hypothetical protein